MKKKFLLLLYLFLMAGCSNYVPKNDISEVNKVDNIKGTNNKQDLNLEFHNDKWWLIYNDANLNKLIDLTLESNSDLKIASYNIDMASATIDTAQESGFKAGLYASGTYHGSSKHTTVTKTATLPVVGKVDPSEYSGKPIYTAGVGLQTSYTFDFYHKYRNLGKQQEFLAQGIAFQEKLARLKITTSLTKLYGYYFYLDQENNNLQERLKTLTAIEDKVKESVRLGVSLNESLLDVQNKILALKSYINLNQFNRKSTINTINSLSSFKHVAEVQEIMKNAKDHKIINQEVVVPSSISSDVIINRPDVQYYVMMIQSQKAKLAATRVDFYPQVSIAGDIGYKGLGVDNSFKDFRSLMWSFGPKVYLPIFNMSGVKTNYKIAGLKVNVFIEQYNQTINNSIKDINEKLTSTQMSKLNYNNQVDNFKNSETIYKNSNSRLQLGAISQYKNLNDKYKYLSADLAKNQKAYKLFSDQVDLVNSLGGIYKTKDQLEENNKGE